MSSDQNPYEQMFSFVNEVFKNVGMDNSDLSVDEYAKRGPTMPKEAMEFLFGNTFNKLGLDAKTKLFLTFVHWVSCLQFYKVKYPVVYPYLVILLQNAE